MGRPPIDFIRAPEFSHIRDADIILACVNPVRIDDLGDIEVVIDNERFLKFFGKFFRFMGFLEYFVFWCIFAAKLDNISAELESSAENIDIMGDEIHSAKFPGLLNM